MAFELFFQKEWDYIRIHLLPVFTYLRSSLRSSLKEWSQQKAVRKHLEEGGILSELTYYKFADEVIFAKG